MNWQVLEMHKKHDLFSWDAIGTLKKGNFGMHSGNSHYKNMSLGVKLFFKFLCPGKYIFASNGPIIQEKRLEWIVACPILKSNTTTDRDSNKTLMSQVVINNLALSNNIK